MQQAEMQPNLSQSCPAWGGRYSPGNEHFFKNSLSSKLIILAILGGGGRKNLFLAASAGHFKLFLVFFFPYETCCFSLVCIWPFEPVLLLSSKGLEVSASQSRAAVCCGAWASWWVCRETLQHPGLALRSPILKTQVLEREVHSSLC